jgi:hypothetical protein
MHLNKTELIAAFKDLIVDTNYRSEKDIFSTFVQMNKGQRDYYEDIALNTVK